MTSWVRFLALASLLLAALCVARDLPAQRLLMAQPGRDCRLTKSAFDNAFSDSKGY